MWCCNKKFVEGGSAEIFREEASKLSKERKILILGSGESGKSTTMKQLKLFQKTCFTPEELEEFKKVVNQNILTNLQDTLSGLIREEIPLQDPSHKPIADEIIAIDCSQFYNQKLTDDLPDKVRTLVKDAAVDNAIKTKAAKYNLDDSAKYILLEHLDRLLDPNYLPCEEDVLRFRIKTTGVAENYLELDGFILRVVDVGGQRSERKKWASCFEEVACIIYVISLSEYDQCLREDEFMNRMNESRELFRNTITNPFLTNVPLVIFYNKIDILKEKLPTSPMEDYFPDYNEGNNLEAAVAYIQGFYRKEIKPEGRTIYEHVTCATDKADLRIVISSILTNLKS